MFLSDPGTVLTVERVLNTRWSWAILGQKPFTTSFYFGDDGLVKVWRHRNESSWTLQDGLLQIFDWSGALSWRFEIVLNEQDQLWLISRQHNDPNFHGYIVLREYNPAATPAAAEPASPIARDVEARPAAGAPEAVRLVIWDLDDTFWSGTLSEGPVRMIDGHADIIRTLNNRGIMSSVCSKNDFAPVQHELERIGLWDEFVFPEIAFAPKGEQVKRIIEGMQLRPESVLFIDDNVTNLNEALFYNPGLQIAEPGFIGYLLEDARLAGKPDLARKRLANYKILEQKATHKTAAKGDNQRFLRDSQVRVSFHTDIEAEFPRIHELVNRTNQLNFTKNRWPEDLTEARNAFSHSVARHFLANTGYVKVADRYGSYGICGFYMVDAGACLHFLFSCRAMNMGVEQFVWKHLRRPFIEIRGEVISEIDMPVDWIEVVDDVDADAAADDQGKITICLRGACDMMVASNFLRAKVNTIEEFNHPYQGWEILALPRMLAIHDEIKTPENQALLSRITSFYGPRRFLSDFITGTSDVYVLSFSQESFQGLYRSKSTGLILPLGIYHVDQFMHHKLDYTRFTHADLVQRHVNSATPQQWEFFRNEFEFIGDFEAGLFEADVSKVFRLLKSHGKQVVVAGMNQSVGTDTFILNFFGKINDIVKPLALAHGFHYLDMADFVKTFDDLGLDGNGGAHYSRAVYAEISNTILDIVKRERLTAAEPSQTIAAE